MRHVIVVIGAGQIGQAIARRVSVGKHIVLADVRAENAEAAANVLSEARYDVSNATGAGYRRMIHASVAKRAGTRDEVGAVGALLMGADGAYRHPHSLFNN